MMIKMLKPYQLLEKGRIVDFPDGRAGDLIERKIAEMVIEEVHKKPRGRPRKIK